MSQTTWFKGHWKPGYPSLFEGLLKHTCDFFEPGHSSETSNNFQRIKNIICSRVWWCSRQLLTINCCSGTFFHERLMFLRGTSWFSKTLKFELDCSSSCCFTQADTFPRKFFESSQTLMPVLGIFVLGKILELCYFFGNDPHWGSWFTNNQSA